MKKNYYLSATEVAAILNVSLSTSYKVIKRGNEILEKDHYQTLPGRIPAPMLEKMYFGLNLTEGRKEEVNAGI